MAYESGNPKYIMFTAATLRDWFAGQAMIAIIQTNADQGGSDVDIARWSYEVANAMMAERSKLHEAAVANSMMAEGSKL